MKKLQLFLLQGLLSSVPLYTLTAQTTTPSTHYAVETGIVAGHGDYSPFWFTANRQGLSSVKTENGYLRAGIFHSQALGRHFTWKAGLDLATAYNYTSSFVVQQAYADLSYRWLNLSIGSKERTPELRNPKLSTGGLVESNSARPVPQVRIEIPQYILFSTELGRHLQTCLKLQWAVGISDLPAMYRIGESKRTMNISLRTNHKCFLVTVPGKTDYWE